MMPHKLLAATLLALMALYAVPAATAGPLAPSSVSVYGYATNTTYGDPAKAGDGVFPAEGSVWKTNNNMWWQCSQSMGEDCLTLLFDYGKTMRIEDITLSVDNNDGYWVEYAGDDLNFATLFEITKNDGDVGWGMDTMSTISGDPEYVGNIDFAPVNARYLLVWNGFGDGMYSVGELQAYGAPVPEPATMLLFASGIAGLAGSSRLRRRRPAA